jgi:hypothetical protein
MKLRYFTRGKDGEHASLLKPSHRFTDRLAVGLAGAIGLEAVDENAITLEFGDVSEDEIGENFDIGTDTSEKNGEQSPAEHAIRMIRHHDYRPSCRNAGAVCRVDPEFDPHFGKKTFQTETFRGALYAPVQISHFADWSQLSGQAGKLRDAG